MCFVTAGEFHCSEYGFKYHIGAFIETVLFTAVLLYCVAETTIVHTENFYVKKFMVKYFISLGTVANEIFNSK